MKSKLELVLSAFTVAARPLVRLLIRQGVTYPGAAERLRGLFIEESVSEIRERGMKPTSSAVSLLSGVHRKDLRSRDLDQPAALATPAVQTSTEGQNAAGTPLGLIGQVVGRWMADERFTDGKRARALRRGGASDDFDALVQGVSTDVGPKAILEEMLRLGVVRLEGELIELDTQGMVPRGDFAAMSEAMGLNLRDHALAACANLVDGRNLLEQALYVDGISAESAERLHQTATRAWRPVLARVLREAEKRSAHDEEKLDATQRPARVRFGVYFQLDEGRPEGTADKESS